MLRQKKLIKFTLSDAIDIRGIQDWFSKSTENRKAIILADGDSED